MRIPLVTGVAVTAFIVLAAPPPVSIEFDPGISAQTESRSIRLSGAIGRYSDEVTRMTWRSGTSAGGSIVPGERWQAGPISLHPGDNHIVFTVWDRRGKTVQNGVHILRTSPDVQPEDSGVLEVNGRSVPFRVFGDTLVADGCIELGSAQAWLGAKGRPAAYALAAPLAGQRWTGNTIPYVLDATLTAPMREMFARAIAHWESRTPIRFVVRGSQANSLRVIRTDLPINTAGGTGMIGGEQVMRLREDADLIIQLHEIGHTVGLLHEQNRPDRDRFVRIAYDNTRKDEFRQIDAVGGRTSIGAYDMQSVMHYEKTFVTRYGLRTIETIPAGVDVYSDDGLSVSDIEAVFRMYGQPRSRIVVATNPAGGTVVVDGAATVTPASFDWAPASKHTLEAPASQGSGATTDRFARWNNDGGRLQTVTVSSDATSYVANFVRHCKLALRPPADPSLGFYTVSPYAADGYYPCDSEVTLTAFPAEGVKFLDWTGAVGATNPRTFRVARAYEIRPNFTRGQTVTFRTEPAGLLVRVNGANYFTPRTFAARDGSVFNVDAVPQSFGTLRYRFSKWSQGGGAAQAIRIAGTASAEFTLTNEALYYASARPLPSTGGTVVLTPPAADGFYPAGTSVQLQASPAANRSFRGWVGDASASTSATATFKMDENRYAEASFRDFVSPTITGFTPERVMAGSEPPILFVIGNGFMEGISQVSVNGQRRGATVIDFNNLSVQLTPEDLQMAANLTVSVANPGRPDVLGGTRSLTVVPTPAGCSIQLSETSVAARRGFATLAVQVKAGEGCPWYPIAQAGWLAAAGSLTGSGEGTLAVWTQPNPSSQSRTGQVKVAGQIVEVVQDGAACDFAAVALSALPPEGGSVTVPVRVFTRDCAWSVAGSADWLQIGGPGTGTGNGEISVTALANVGAPRESVLKIGNLSVGVRQSGLPGAIVNEANRLPALANGSRFVMPVEGLAEADATADGGWPDTLGGLVVLFGETKARLASVKGALIVGQVPAGVSGEVTVQVMRGEQVLSTQVVTIRESAPAVYPASPLAGSAGELVTLRLTGVGLANPPIADGEAAPADPVAIPAAAITAEVNGIAVLVESARMAPGEVGIAEIQLRLPADMGPGEKTLVMRAGGAEASPVTLSVQ